MRFREEFPLVTNDKSWFGFLGGLGVQFRGSRPLGGFCEVVASEVLIGQSSTAYLALRGGLTLCVR